METYVIGDIHGAFRALEQVLERSPFRPGIDRLVQIGDVSDGWPETPECVECLLTIPNSIWLQGNHDWWTTEWMETQPAFDDIYLLWYRQGGQATYESYQRFLPEVVEGHLHEFFKQQVPYFTDEHNNLYVHGGYDPEERIEDQEPFSLVWDRDLWQTGEIAHGYQNCFIGHTPTWPECTEPCQRANVWNVDQGAAYSGRLSMMNVRTKEFVQSDIVKSLYPGVKGRGG